MLLTKLAAPCGLAGSHATRRLCIHVLSFCVFSMSPTKREHRVWQSYSIWEGGRCSVVTHVPHFICRLALLWRPLPWCLSPNTVFSKCLCVLQSTILPADLKFRLVSLTPMRADAREGAYTPSVSNSSLCSPIRPLVFSREYSALSSKYIMSWGCAPTASGPFGVVLFLRVLSAAINKRPDDAAHQSLDTVARSSVDESRDLSHLLIRPSVSARERQDRLLLGNNVRVRSPEPTTTSGLSSLWATFRIYLSECTDLEYMRFLSLILVDS